MLLPRIAHEHRRRLRPPRRGYVHPDGQGRRALHPLRPRQGDHTRAGARNYQARRGKRPHARHGQHRRAGRERGHLQLLRLRLLRPARGPDVRRARRDPLQLRCRGGRGQVRRLRPVRGDLPRQRAQARPEALLDRGPDTEAGLRQALRDPAPEAHLGPELPRGPRGRRAHRHRPVQDRLPRAHPRAGLPEARRAGPLHGRARAHQERKPVPGRLRPHLQQALRGRVHPRRRGRGRRHRRGQALHRRP